MGSGVNSAREAASRGFYAVGAGCAILHGVGWAVGAEWARLEVDSELWVPGLTRPAWEIVPLVLAIAVGLAVHEAGHVAAANALKVPVKGVQASRVVLFGIKCVSTYRTCFFVLFFLFGGNESVSNYQIPYL